MVDVDVLSRHIEAVRVEGIQIPQVVLRSFVDAGSDGAETHLQTTNI